MDMEELDVKKVEQVWQRVRSRESPSPGKSPGELIALCMAQCSRYRRLSQHLSGKYAQQLRGYACQQQKNANCMRGLCRISGLALPPERPEKAESAHPLLRTCIQVEKELEDLWHSRISDPGWGNLYRLLAAEALERCRGLLEILGEVR